MTSARRRGIGSPLRARLFACYCLALSLFCSVAASEPLTRVIANEAQASHIQDKTLLRGVFTLRVRSWPDGTPVRVFVLSDSEDLHKSFCREYLGTYPYVLRGAWDQKVFTGTGLAPIQVSSEEEMKRRVSETVGAVGYIASSAEPEAALTAVSTALMSASGSALR